MIYKNKLILLIFLFVLLIIYYIIFNTKINFINSYGKHTKSNMFVLKLPAANGSGFFSCCSLRLDKIVNFINSNKILPDEVDSSKYFIWYKNHINKSKDITFDYFEHYNNIKNIEISFPIKYRHMDQYKDYSTLDYKNISPLIKKYFSPSVKINQIINNIKKKYNLIYENICVLFYRGNDKNKETAKCSYDEYLNYANQVITENPKIMFLIQSDETEFIEYMTKKFPNNSFYFKDEIRHMKKDVTNTVDTKMNFDNFKFSKLYLAITIIMSKSKYIICSSGNCDIWIILYRGNNKNTIQYLNGTWYNNVF